MCSLRSHCVANPSCEVLNRLLLSSRRNHKQKALLFVCGFAHSTSAIEAGTYIALLGSETKTIAALMLLFRSLYVGNKLLAIAPQRPALQRRDECASIKKEGAEAPSTACKEPWLRRTRCGSISERCRSSARAQSSERSALLRRVLYKLVSVTPVLFSVSFWRRAPLFL